VLCAAIAAAFHADRQLYSRLVETPRRRATKPGSDRTLTQEVINLIEDPTLIQAELDRRLDAARAAEPTKRRQEALERELTRIRKSMERLLTAYQEDLLSLDELPSDAGTARPRGVNAG
jgi:hypothetical protein